MADDQGGDSGLSNQQKDDTATKRKEEERAAPLAALTNARKALEEQRLRERTTALALEKEREAAWTLEHQMLAT
jgi:hypothetical protein